MKKECEESRARPNTLDQQVTALRFEEHKKERHRLQLHSQELQQLRLQQKPTSVMISSLYTTPFRSTQHTSSLSGGWLSQCDPMLGSLPLCQCSASYFTVTRNYVCVFKLLRIKGTAYDIGPPMTWIIGYQV
uniref:AlNc14C370G11095 protein n=1 Tax=Albugo laibachii Nc14 TaxID=890382 RepID=F0WY50_9STRA|nr:AlNc14C370G11095 [Albugo laibachii Nc14]|eukprot:CCA26400.1 AlNc14C370G11095 [Albugo laibachii Nc14]